MARFEPSCRQEVESAVKPGSVKDSHSSGAYVAMRLKQPTREPCGSHVGTSPCPPIWSCSEWGFPCRFRCRKRGALLPHHFTLTFRPRRLQGGIFSVALSVGSRLPGVTWHSTLRSPDFPPPAIAGSDCLGRLRYQSNPIRLPALPEIWQAALQEPLIFFLV